MIPSASYNLLIAMTTLAQGTGGEGHIQQYISYELLESLLSWGEIELLQPDDLAGAGNLVLLSHRLGDE